MGCYLQVPAIRLFQTILFQSAMLPFINDLRVFLIPDYANFLQTSQSVFIDSPYPLLINFSVFFHSIIAEEVGVESEEGRRHVDRLHSISNFKMIAHTSCGNPIRRSLPHRFKAQFDVNCDS